MNGVHYFGSVVVAEDQIRKTVFLCEKEVRLEGRTERVLQKPILLKSWKAQDIRGTRASIGIQVPSRGLQAYIKMHPITFDYMYICICICVWIYIE